MPDPERNQQVYVTADSKQWLIIDWPFGLISPPTMEFHQPLVGPVIFYHADSYQLPIPREAEEAQYPMRFINVEEGGCYRSGIGVMVHGPGCTHEP